MESEGEILMLKIKFYFLDFGKKAMIYMWLGLNYFDIGIVQMKINVFLILLSLWFDQEYNFVLVC